MRGDVMSEPKVTVLMSVYNGERYLREAVESILNQTFEDFLFLIVNDGSTDGTGSILQGYGDRRIRLVENEKNLGLTRSLNRGIEMTRSEYVARMDADDVSSAERLEKQVCYLEDNPEVGLLGTRYMKIDEEGNEGGEIHVPIGRDMIKKKLLVGNAFCHGSVVMRRSVLEKTGFYDENLTFAQDYDLWLRISDICPVENYPEVLHRWRLNERSGISVKNFFEQGRLALNIRERHIRGKIEKGSLDMSGLLQLAVSNPTDQLISHIAMEECDRREGFPGNFQTDYLKLGYLHRTPGYRYLNDLAELYLRRGKRSLAFMCLVESLRENPEQPGILKRAELLLDARSPRFLEHLPEETCAVSVIMPTYNRTEEIRQSIQSVLDQTYEDFELIVVNDGGTDEVENITNSFNSSKIRYYKLNENRGLSGALNEGVIRARGRYIAYLDDDDVYYPDHIEKLVDCIEKNPSFDCVYANAWWCYGEKVGDSFVEHYRNVIQRPEAFHRGALGESNYISTLNILHRKSCFMKAGFFNEDLGKLMDWDLWLRFSACFNFHQIEGVTGEYRWKQNNMSVEDRLDVEFLYRIVGSFYEFCQGRVAIARSYLSNGMRGEAENIFREVMDGYGGCVKTPSLTRYMFHLFRSMRDSIEMSFQVRLTRDFFDADPRACLNEIFAGKSPFLVCLIFDLLLLRVCRSLRYRTSKHVRTALKKFPGAGP